jgi:hypothetical protein
MLATDISNVSDGQCANGCHRAILRSNVPLEQVVFHPPIRLRNRVKCTIGTPTLQTWQHLHLCKHDYLLKTEYRHRADTSYHSPRSTVLDQTHLDSPNAAHGNADVTG